MIASFLTALLLVSPAAATTAGNMVEAESWEDPDDEVICRRRMMEDARFAGRPRAVRVCKTREEWRNERPASGRR